MNKKIKIGIITFWDSQENYGQLLQMYALQSFLTGEGFEVFLIRYDRFSYIKGLNIKTKKLNKPLLLLKLARNPLNSFKRIYSSFLNKRKKRIIINETNKYPRYFSEFINENVKVSKTYFSLNELQCDPPEADCYITGSDVVWTRSDPAFFLSFGNKATKRISYAASFGKESIAQTDTEIYKQLLGKIDFITVREPQGITICSSLGRDDAELVLDPTFLVSHTQYRKIQENNETTNNFCFLYLIGHKTNFPVKEIKDICNDKNLSILYSTCQRYDTYTKVYPTVNEWLGYIDNAKMIVTNSYHGCIYAIIYRKNFIFLPMIKEHSVLNNRITTLLERLDLKDRIFNNNLDILFNKNIDYNKVHNELDKLINNSKSLLLSTLAEVKK